MADCDHEWETIDEEEGTYRTEVCMVCNANRFTDFVNNRESISLEVGNGEIERDGNLYCGACGMLAQPGNEEYDWCDHTTGQRCAYYEEENPDDDWDDYPDMEQ